MISRHQPCPTAPLSNQKQHTCQRLLVTSRLPQSYLGIWNAALTAARKCHAPRAFSHSLKIVFAICSYFQNSSMAVHCHHSYKTIHLCAKSTPLLALVIFGPSAATYSFCRTSSIGKPRPRNGCMFLGPYCRACCLEHKFQPVQTAHLRSPRPRCAQSPMSSNASYWTCLNI